MAADPSDEPATKKFRTSTSAAKSIFDVLPAPKGSSSSAKGESQPSSSTTTKSSATISKKISSAPAVRDDEGLLIEEEQDEVEPKELNESHEEFAQIDALEDRGEKDYGPSIGATMPDNSGYEAYPEPEEFATPNPRVDLYSTDPSLLAQNTNILYASYAPVSALGVGLPPSKVHLPPELKWGELHDLGEQIEEVNAASLTDMGNYTTADKAQLERLAKLSGMKSSSSASKRTGHISHLVMEAEQAELLAMERKVAQKMLQRETRQRYGW
jgi:hypothetical protein